MQIRVIILLFFPFWVIGQTSVINVGEAAKLKDGEIFVIEDQTQDPLFYADLYSEIISFLENKYRVKQEVLSDISVGKLKELLVDYYGYKNNDLAGLSEEELLELIE